MDSTNSDEILFGVLKEQKSVFLFLDSVFGFLYRCTDFYHVQDESSGKVLLGGPSGAASAVVQQMFHRYEMQARIEKESADLHRLAQQFKSDIDNNIPVACHEVEVGTDIQDNSDEEFLDSNKKEIKNSDSDTFNGDDRTIYKWSQEIQEVNVHVPISKELQVKNLNVEIEPFRIKLDLMLKDEWIPHYISNKTFPFKVKAKESVWSLLHGFDRHQLSFVLFKDEKRWWDRLFNDDPPINTKLICTDIQTYDLSQEEQMKIEEVMLKNNEKAN